MKNSIKIGEKKTGKKRGGWCSLLVMMFGGAVFRVQCVFPNMESENREKKQKQKQKKNGSHYCWGTAFRVHVRVLCTYLKREISSSLTKK
jgi:hypothetical protein